MVEIKFRRFDGTDIGPFEYSPTARVITLKQNLLSRWPKTGQRRMTPISARDIKLISAGRVLEDNQTVEECTSQYVHLSVIIMHVVVQPGGGRVNRADGTCACTIM